METPWLREVWDSNLEEEFAVLRDLIEKYPYVSMVKAPKTRKEYPVFPLFPTHFLSSSFFFFFFFFKKKLLTNLKSFEY